MAQATPPTWRRRHPPRGRSGLAQWWNELVVNGFHAVHLPEKVGGQDGTLMYARAWWRRPPAPRLVIFGYDDDGS
jgi:alkylation response protein AidB-like acyl-CoA dehydrogenase